LIRPQHLEPSSSKNSKPKEGKGKDTFRKNRKTKNTLLQFKGKQIFGKTVEIRRRGGLGPVSIPGEIDATDDGKKIMKKTEHGQRKK